jgi:hypothetical protein
LVFLEPIKLSHKIFFIELAPDLHQSCFLYRHLRNEMSQAALERIQNLQDRDLFLSFDADEIPKAEVGT